MNDLECWIAEAVEKGYAWRFSSAVRHIVPTELKDDESATSKYLKKLATNNNLKMLRTYTVQGTIYELYRIGSPAETDGTQNHVH